MWTRKELKARAKAGLKQNYWKAVLVGIIDMVLFGTAAAAGRGQGGDATEAFRSLDLQAIVAVLPVLLGAAAVIVLFSCLINVFLLDPIRVGIAKFETEALDGAPGLNTLGRAFTGGSYLNCVKTLFLRDLYVFLWSLLLVVPGVIKALEYSQVEYLLAEDPSLSTKEALARSKEMMVGNKWKYLVLLLSFIGWHILSALTFGLLEVFFVHPYELLTEGAFYEAIRK